MGGSLGQWEPLTVEEVCALLDGAPLRWWVTGGRALELHVGASWRAHEDIDVGVVRSEAQGLHPWLGEWHLAVASGGVLTPWDGRALEASRHHNNVWVGRGLAGPWVLDVAIGEGTDDGWVFRRDPTVTRPWDRAVLRSGEGIPYLAPEIQMLFKAKDPRPKDHLDAEIVAPTLSGAQRRWLREHLPSTHPWQGILGDSPAT